MTVTAVLQSIRTAPPLQAHVASFTSNDTDSDGLSNAHEEALLTSPDNADTDGDGYSDLEEVCRQTDPRDRYDSPPNTEALTGMSAHVANGMVSILFAAYVDAGDMSSLGYQAGIVISGIQIDLNLACIAGGGMQTYPAFNSGDTIVVLETTIPEIFIHILGSLGVYGIHAGGPANSFDESAGVLNLASYGGTVANVERSPDSIRNGKGVVYRPIGPKSNVPPGWRGGEICWQETSLAGVSGASLVYDVDAATCESMDTYCNASECSASVGGTIEIIDPGALIGG